MAARGFMLPSLRCTRAILGTPVTKEVDDARLSVGATDLAGNLQ